MVFVPNSLICFEATGGQEWRLWAALEVLVFGRNCKRSRSLRGAF
jgi:hypothetical protein